ncbi:1210_t:CDS:2, partial [Ambispora leptoticha]
AWTSTNNYAFLAITAHWITKDWKLQDELLDFINLSGPHSGENLCEAFVKSCHEFGILTKIFTITSDNASNNDTFMKYLEIICEEENISFNAINSHCRCIAHIINLVVQDILKQIKAGEAQTEDNILDNIDTIITAGEIIPKLRKLIVKIRSSPQRKERFIRHAEHLKCVNSDKELQNFEFSDDEWYRINEIISVLKIFVRTTKALSSAKYPMLSSVIPIYNYLIDGLETYCDKFDSPNDIVTAVKAGLKKLETYYTKTDNTTIYTIATVLDPRFKLDYYIDNNWKQNFIHYAKKTVLDVYTNYISDINTEDDNNDDNDENDEFLDHIFGKQQKIQNNEVELYLKTPRAARDQDILL